MEEEDDINKIRDPLPQVGESWNPIVDQPGIRLQGLTYSKFQRDEVSSAMQKSIRRGLWKESIQWVMELFWMNHFAKKNAWKRLLVTSVEDVSPSCAYAPLGIWYLYQNDGDNPLAIATAAMWLSTLPKSRVNDWAAHANKRMTPEAADKLGTPVEMGAKLREALTNKNIGTSLYYADVLFYQTQKVGRYIAYREVWKVINEICGEQSYSAAISEIVLSEGWRNKYGASRLFHNHVIHLWCWNNGKFYPNYNIYEIVYNPDVVSIVDKYTKREDMVGVPDYAIDAHTAKGREWGRKMDFFMKYGAQITNEDDDWLQLSDFYLSKQYPKYRNAYYEGQSYILP